MTEPDEVTIDTVDHEITGGFRSLLFAPDLEHVYETETRRDRERYFIRTGQLAVVLYDLFLFCDWQMTPDVFQAALIARLGIFTPLFLVCWFVLRQKPPMQVREGVASAFAIFSVVSAMWVLNMSRSADLMNYEYGTVLIMLFTAVVQRLRIRYAISTILCILAVQFTSGAHIHDITPRLLVNLVIFYLTAAVLLLWAAYALEREQRRSFLLDLRSRMLNDHLQKMAKQDALTGLWNRRHFDTVVTNAWADARATPRSMAVILLDIDHFKAFNDSNGHLEGDKCLQVLAARVDGAVGKDDKTVTVRFGGEELLVFLDGADLAFATRAATRIQAAIKAAAIPHPVLGIDAIVTASFGVATGPAPDLSINRLMAAADDALYRSKRSGRNCISLVAIDADGTSVPDTRDLLVAC